MAVRSALPPSASCGSRPGMRADGAGKNSIHVPGGLTDNRGQSLPGNADHDGGLRGGTGVPSEAANVAVEGGRPSRSFRDTRFVRDKAPYVVCAVRSPMGLAVRPKRPGADETAGACRQVRGMGNGMAQRSPAGRGEPRREKLIRKARPPRPASRPSPRGARAASREGQWPDRKRGVAGMAAGPAVPIGSRPVPRDVPAGHFPSRRFARAMRSL